MDIVKTQLGIAGGFKLEELGLSPGIGARPDRGDMATAIEKLFAEYLTDST